MKGVVGFDFGTTNSLISFVEGDRAINILEDGLPFPSVVSYQGDSKIVGRKAKELLSEANASVIGNVVRSPKMLLGKGIIDVEGVRRHPRDIAADVISWVRRRAMESEYPGSYETAVVTIPVDMEGRRRAELREAFRQAGMSVRQFVHEPLAALYGYVRSRPGFPGNLRELEGELVLVFDWGGGTLDLTLCRIIDGLLVQVRNDGTSAVGGDIVDAAIRNYVLQKVSETRPEVGQRNPQAGARERLLARAERAKIELSTQEQYPVYVPAYFALQTGDADLLHNITRAELNSVCEPYLEQAVGRINRLLEAAGASRSAVALCVCTGGMVNMPLIQARLLEHFGAQRLQLAKSGATAIAEGAAWIAHDDQVLSLAKNIELRVAVNTYMPVIYAGTRMPREGQVSEAVSFEMFCTDPRDRHAKFQLCAPVEPGLNAIDTDERAALGTMTIRVHDTEPFLERLRFDASIDENLILKASAFSTMEADRKEIEVHNLEFGLQIGEVAPPPGNRSRAGGGDKPRRQQGTITLRPNVARTADRKLIPGDLLHKVPRGRHEPNPFDREWGWATEHQHQEKQYYQPCSICRRMINDPLCKCAAGPQPDAAVGA
jgi:molecular chaperone DnaK